MFVFDTCGLLWYTEDPEKLSERAANACQSVCTDGAFVSAISIWEIGIKVKKGKLDIGTDIEDYLQRLKRLNTIEIIPVDEDIWVRSLTLDWEHSDPADRVIVATAERLNLPLVTSDAVISAYYPEVIW